MNGDRVERGDKLMALVRMKLGEKGQGVVGKKVGGGGGEAEVEGAGLNSILEWVSSR